MSYRSRVRARPSSLHPLVAFLLLASFGILFAGCRGPQETREDDAFVFTADDVARFKQLAREGEEATTGSGIVRDEKPYLEPLASTGELITEDGDGVPVLRLDMLPAYRAIRAGAVKEGENTYRVTNTFLNVRASPSVTAASAGRLVKGESVTVLEFADAAWAKVKLADGKMGFVAVRYIAKPTSEEKLAAEKEAFKGMHFVDFGFVNVRKAPDAQSEKLGELPGQTIVRPISMDAVWARIPYQGKEGYVAVEYLSPFLPNFLVRQERYVLPFLHYRANQDGVTAAIGPHIALLKREEIRFMTLSQFRDLLLAQEERDVRLPPRSVALLVSGVTADNAQSVSDALTAAGVSATLFVETESVGLRGLTEKALLTLRANGFDVQSAGHTGDDLRALTNAQVSLELVQSRKLLEERTAQDVFAIAYPQGGVNDRVMALADESGYLLGITDQPERSFTREQLLRLPSLLVIPSMTPEDVLKLVRGN